MCPTNIFFRINNQVHHIAFSYIYSCPMIFTWIRSIKKKNPSPLHNNQKKKKKKEKKDHHIKTNKKASQRGNITH